MQAHALASHPSLLLAVVAGRLETVARAHGEGSLGEPAEAFFLAAINGQLAILKYLRESGNDVAAAAGRALPLAAAGCRLEVVKYLREAGCDFALHGAAALRAAAQKGCLDLVEDLHHNGGTLETCSAIAPELPALGANRGVVHYLAANGVLPEGPGLMQLIDAIRRGDASNLRAALPGVPVSRHSALLMRCAAESGAPEIARLLHESGCDLCADSDIALTIAAERGTLALVQYLHRNGADVHARDEEALRAAAVSGHLPVVSYLVANGADITRVDPETLALVSMNGYPEILDHLGTTPAIRGGLVTAASAATDGRGTVSVLLANYNHAQYLPTALAGIRGQTRPATEIIVVDDGSTDNSVAIIEEFARQFPGVRVLRNGRNRGQHYSIQRALLAARGEYVVWAASDDLLLPNFLERMLAELRSHPQAGLCFSRLAVMVDGTDEVREYTGETQDARFDYGTTAHYLSPRDLTSALRKRYIWMSGNTVVARRAALLEAGGFERSLRWHADWFAYYVVALRHGACVIPETLALMRERGGTYSGHGIADSRQQRQVLGAILDAITSPKYRDVLPAFRDHPALLSLFGRQAIWAALRRPRDWRTAWALALWHAPRFPAWLLGKVQRRLRQRHSY